MTAALSLLRSYRLQNLLVEFAALKHINLQGIYLSLSPRDPALWTGTVFVRKGVYASAVLRFRVSFPSSYPFAPPVITFNADIFHPLVTPSTTSSYSSVDNDGSSNDGDYRLPPGALSLRHAFPAWFRQISDSDRDLSIVDALRYMRVCFEDQVLLDSIPFEAAANPSAWYAWQSYRGKSTKNPPTQDNSTNSGSPEARSSTDGNSQAAQSRAKRPSDWNWEGVWLERVKKAIQNSLAEQVLYGAGNVKEDDIHFLDADNEATESMRAEMKARTAET